MHTPNDNDVGNSLVLLQGDTQSFVDDIVSAYGIRIVSDLSELEVRSYRNGGGRILGGIKKSDIYSVSSIRETFERRSCESPLDTLERIEGWFADIDHHLLVPCRPTSDSLTHTFKVTEYGPDGTPRTVDRELTSTKVNCRRVRYVDAQPFSFIRMKLMLVVRQFEFEVCTTAPDGREEKVKRHVYEQVPGLTTRYGRWTCSLQDYVYKTVALTPSSTKALAELWNVLKTSRHTLLRRLQRQEIVVDLAGHRHIGVDDFALRKGMVYCTVIVDLDTREVIEVIGGRKKEEVAAALRKYQNVEVVTRDGSLTYAASIEEAFDVCVKQVMDKFHAVQRLLEAMQKDLYDKDSRVTYLSELGLAQTMFTALLPDGTEEDLDGNGCRPTERKTEDFNKVKEALENGHTTVADVARLTGLSEPTCRKYMHQDGPQASKPFDFSDCSDHFFTMAVGISRGDSRSDIFADCKAAGMKASRNAFDNYFRKHISFYTADMAKKVKENLIKIRVNNLSPEKRALAELERSSKFRFMMGCKFDEEAPLSPEEWELRRKYKALIASSPFLSDLHGAFVDFLDILQSKDPGKMREWVDKYKGDTRFKAVAAFAARQAENIEPLLNAVTYGDYTNSITEAVNNKIKEIKRGLYGRCGWNFLYHKIMCRQDLMRPVLEYRREREAKKEAAKEAKKAV